jgi:cysteine-rich repeat protein
VVLNNTTGTGSYGSCSLQDLTVCSTDPVVTVDECAPNGSINSCNGLPVTNLGTIASGEPEDTIPGGILGGFCMDATLTPCTSAGSTGSGANVTCGGAGTCSDNAAPCTATDLALCADPGTASCSAPGVLIGDGICWSGCGTCTAGRDFNCAEFQYTGHNTNFGGTSGDLKCTGAPYSLANGNVAADTIALGTVAQGGSLPFQIQINAGDSSFCVHTFLVLDDPYGDLAGFGCTSTCGDGFIATGADTPELCEPKRASATTTPPDATPLIPNDIGCDDVNTECVAGCSLCVPIGGLCGNGSLDVGEACDDGNLVNGDCCSATCNFEALGASCGAAADLCEVQDTCDGAGTCTDNGFVGAGTTCRASIAGGSVPPGTCDPEEQCDGVSAACPADAFAPPASPCDDGAAPAGDTCNGAGMCIGAGCFCGDGSTAGCPGEACDDGALNGTTTCGCSATCQFPTAAVMCSAGSGDSCDPAEFCDGAGACDADVVTGAGTECRAAAGACDVAEQCDGVPGNACPADGFALDGTVCVASSNFGCVLADTCTAGACTDNGNAPDTTPCDNGAGTGPPDECIAGSCDDIAAPSTSVTTVVPIKGTSADTYNSAGSDGDYNTGMTSGDPTIEWYTSLPNDPQVTNYGTDKVWADVSFSGALAGGDVVSCTINPGGIVADVSDCGTGDLTCKVFGAHPELTAVVSDAQTPGPVTGTFPDEVDTALAISMSCQVNATAPVVANGDVALGTVGVPDGKLAPGGAGSFAARVVYYCADGTSQDCSDANAGGDASVGIRANLAVIHVDPAVFSCAGNCGVSGGVRANPANAYGFPENSGPCNGQVNPAIVSCVDVGGNAIGVTGPAVGGACTGWMVGNIATCNLAHGAQAAGTYTVIDTTTISADFLYYLNGGGGLPIRGLDAGFNPLPTANVSGQVIFN